MKINKIIGKPIYFIDRNGANRINKVLSIHGNNITTMDAAGGKERVHPSTSMIYGIITGQKGNVPTIESIEYKEIRVGRKLKNKIIRREINAAIVKPLRTKRPQAGRPRKVK